MPAVASLEDLRTAQKEGVSIYAMRHAFCSMRLAMAHKMLINLPLCCFSGIVRQPDRGGVKEFGLCSMLLALCDL